jgi:hypothetical protein
VGRAASDAPGTLYDAAFLGRHGKAKFSTRAPRGSNWSQQYSSGQQKLGVGRQTYRIHLMVKSLGGRQNLVNLVLRDLT